VLLLKIQVHGWGLGSLALVLATCGLVSAQELPSEPFHESGQDITGAFEGWFPNQDGTYSLLMGYFNSNQHEPMDILTGPDNQIEPGGPDQGQPTHFLPGRKWGLFTITVPKDFGDKHFTWTIVANGKTTVIPLSLNVLWRLEPFVDATGKTPPYIGFSYGGPFVNGPVGQSESITAKVSTPLPLTVWLADDAKNNMIAHIAKRSVVVAHWIMLRGPGEVKFDNDTPPVERAELKSPPAGTPFTGKATTTVTFSEPGEYILNLQVDDSTGGGPAGRQCCWSNAKVKVSVKP
jgi:hypothetical protein